jgi:hypothetical protein
MAMDEPSARWRSPCDESYGTRGPRLTVARDADYRPRGTEVVIASTAYVMNGAWFTLDDLVTLRDDLTELIGVLADEECGGTGHAEG